MTLLSVLFMPCAFAHDPVFGLGPHVLFKGGVEIAPTAITAEKADGRETETSMDLTYGLTGDWASVILWAVGFFAAFIALPLRIWLDF